jgi:restriction endonuclease S subunit
VISSEIFRVVLKENINPHYLVSWLNSKPQQVIFDRIKTGGIMGHLSQEVVCQIKIPLPSYAVQNKIDEEVKKRLQKTEQLQKEAKEELEKEKQKIEKIILGK